MDKNKIRVDLRYKQPIKCPDLSDRTSRLGHQTVPVTLRVYGGVITATPPSRLRLGVTSRRDGSRYGVGRNTAPRNRASTRNLRVFADQRFGEQSYIFYQRNSVGRIGAVRSGEIEWQYDFKLPSFSCICTAPFCRPKWWLGP
jgi:hypothetical protein